MAGEVEIIPPQRGRPSLYTQELADRICDLIASGETIRTICAMEDMPDWGTIWYWKNKKPDFLAQYTRAREASAEMFEAEILDVSRNVRIGEEQATRILTDNLRWAAARRASKMFGDKITQEHTGADGKELQIPTLMIVPFDKNEQSDEN